MSRNISKEHLETMCVCRFYISPGHEYECPVHGSMKNKGALTNPIENNMKVGQTPTGRFCVEEKTGQQWKWRDDLDFDTRDEALQHLKTREILFRDF